MRLINTISLELKEFFDSQIPKYAILSHRWGEDEVTFEEYTSGQNQKVATYRLKSGYQKILDLCRIAREGVRVDGDGSAKYEWAWIDTICIDKSSSAELSEAINSMYKWYEKSEVCLVFLPDVTAVPPTNYSQEDVITLQGHSSFSRAQFVKSVWFTRGWTLQELIAPRMVSFYDNQLNLLGSMFKRWPADRDAGNDALYYAAAQAAHIDKDSLSTAEAAEKARSIAGVLSWAAHRETTRAEDMTYCLLGLCKVNMPLLYGEGGLRAFRRLQLEIIASNPDVSILAFRQDAFRNTTGILASDVSQFLGCMGPSKYQQRGNILTRSPRGLEFHVQVPRGIRHLLSEVPLFLLSLTSASNRVQTHVLLIGRPGSWARNYEDGCMEVLRVGCCTSNSRLSDRSVWQQIMGWRALDGTLSDLLVEGSVPWAVKGYVPRQVTLLGRARQMMYRFYPAKTIKVWAPL